MTLPTIEQIEALLANATPEPWTGHNMVHADHGGPMTPEEIGEYVANSVKVGDPDRFLFVSGRHDDGGYADVCHTGNGPLGMHNTALIALAPTLAAQRIADAKRITELEAEKEAAFNAGYVIACCNISNLHSEEEIAHDVLSQIGVTEAQIADMDLSEYDAAAIGRIIKGRYDSPFKQATP